MNIEIIDFYAEWCGPCKAMSPMIESMQKEFPEGNESGVTIRKVNVDSDPELAKKYNIRSIPTLVFIKDGVEKDRASGLKNKAFMEEKINEMILNN
jgi:thioredoxin 1